MQKRKTPGFTLAEMLVVILVIGLLLSIAVPLYTRAVAHANRVRCAKALRHLGEAFHARMSEETRTGQIHSLSPETWVDELAPFYSNHDKALLCPDDPTPVAGRPYVRLAIWSHGGYNESNLFNMYPYWLEGPCPDPGPGVWKLNEEDYAEFRSLGDTQFYAPDVLGAYTPGKNPDVYWFVVEEGRENGLAGSERDYNDLHIRVENTKDTLEATFERWWTGVDYALLMPDGTRIGGQNESIGNNETISIPKLNDSSYGLNWQASRLLGYPDKVLMLDYGDETVYIGGNTPFMQFWDEKVAPRHSDKVNVLFMGGYVELRDPDEINPEDANIEQALWSPGV
jgi:prepilin-type N-terminal cleavage/methylation domain-containing protein/prepilin-type processing-associated H-X9-DG protein